MNIWVNIFEVTQLCEKLTKILFSIGLHGTCGELCLYPAIIKLARIITELDRLQNK